MTVCSKSPFPAAQSRFVRVLKRTVERLGLWTMDLKLLREATRPEHEATESVVPLMAADLSRETYVAVLQRFSTVVSAWDACAEKNAPEPLQALVAARRRSASIAEDLQFFDVVTKQEAPSPALQEDMRQLMLDGTAVDASRFLGAMYVVEGSTLGGRYIAAHVEARFGLTPGQGDRYFRGYGDQTMPMWREFQQALVAVPDGESDRVIAAAREMFGVFQRVLGSTHLANMVQTQPESIAPAAGTAS